MRLTTIVLVSTLALGLLAGLLRTEAQQAGKVYWIEILTGGSASTSKRNIDPFRQGLRELGYVDEKNIVIEYRHADGKMDRLPELAAELVRTKVDVILVAGTRAITAAAQATSTIPIIAGGAGDLVGTGLVASLSRPPRREHHGLHPYGYGDRRETNRAVEGSCFTSLARSCNLVHTAGPG